MTQKKYRVGIVGLSGITTGIDGALEKSLHQALGSSINLGQALGLPQSFGYEFFGTTLFVFIFLH